MEDYSFADAMERNELVARTEAAEGECERLRQKLAADEITFASCNRARQAAEAECERLQEQVAILEAQLQEVRTEYRTACEDFCELLEARNQ